MREEDPDAFKDRPDLDAPEIDEFDQEYLNAFFMLTSSRQAGFGVGPIALSEILSYCTFFEIDDPELMVYVIQRADNAYLTAYYEEQERKNPKK